jgi:2-dehydropantoate 2-reductase
MTASHWHVLGAGALGCLFASHLRRAGATVTLVLRDNAAPGAPAVGEAAVGMATADDTTPHQTPKTATDHTPTASKWIQVGGVQGDHSFQVATTTRGDPGAIPRLLVTTKAYDVLGALAGVAHRLTPDAQVLLLVNGMGLAEPVAEAHPGCSVFLATTTQGAYRRGPLAIVHAGEGSTAIGSPLATPPPAWMNDWLSTPGECRWEPDIERALWQKLAVNCAINPLTAVHGCRNGALVSEPRLIELTARVGEEIAAVCAAAGYPDIATGLHERVTAVARATAANRSSMLQDVAAGRPTEIDYITGFLVDTAARLGIDAPLNRELMAAVKALEPAETNA